MNLLLIMAGIGFVQHEPIVDDRADVIEVNYVFDGNADLVLEQVIFWQWHGDGEYRVLDWRFKKSGQQMPWRDWHRGGYVTIWQDGLYLRRVRAPVFRETWLHFDPEVADRRYLPQHLRRGLSRISKPTSRH